MRRLLLEGAMFSAALVVTAGSAILVKEASTSPPPAARVESRSDSDVQESEAIDRLEWVAAEAVPHAGPVTGGTWMSGPASSGNSSGAAGRVVDPLMDPSVRWFNGRPVRPARVMTMTVTGYSPDARSCGDSADGMTATLHSVSTNHFRLVAADPRVLPYGSMVSIPGYDEEHIVPVLDCGGAIKGARLDLLFPTHAEAKAWGVKRLQIVVWQYADGRPPDNPRRLRR